MRFFKSIFLLVLFSIFYSILALSQQFQSNTTDLAIQGYSPVSYFTKNLAERGKAEFSATYHFKTYYFSSKQQVRLFRGNPEKYVPQFGGHCTYNLALGRKINIDPRSFKIINNRLFLFHNDKNFDALKMWNKQPNEKDLLEKARGQFTFYKFG